MVSCYDYVDINATDIDDGEEDVGDDVISGIHHPHPHPYHHHEHQRLIIPLIQCYYNPHYHHPCHSS